MDFLYYIWYHDQVPLVTDACRIEFASVLNLSNYGHYFHKSCVFDISEKNLLMLFMFGTVITATRVTHTVCVTRVAVM